MDGSIAHKQAFEELDRAPVPEAWWPDLSRTLLELGASITPTDRPILAALVAYLARHSPSLREFAAKKAPVEPPREIHGSHPGSATLFRYLHGQSAGLERLTTIGLCALLEASHDGRNQPKRLLSIVRGALDSPNSPLSGALGAIDSIPQLIRLVDTDEATRKGLPPHFLQLWDGWLRDTLIRWMLAEPDRLRQALEPTTLLPQPDDPQVPVSLGSGAVEDGTILADSSFSAFSGTNPESALDQGVRAAASLERASIGDLLAPAELHLPKAIDEQLCRSAVTHAERYLGHDGIRAESFVALALVLAGGIREVDLRNVVWGGESAARPYSIDPATPILFRRLKRPANAVQPPKELADWLEPAAEVMAWPLPSSVHTLLLKLGDGAHPGQAVLPALGGSLAPPYRLHAVVEQLVPEAKVGALASRQTLASEIAEALGPEMAQLSMADTFGMSSIPAYYSALPESALAAAIAGIQSRRFDETVVAPAGRQGHVGSRLVLTDAAAKRWPGLLREAVKQASQQVDDVVAQWRAHRDHLVAALCSATGHRPENALGKIFLGDVIPEYHVIILQDKQVDALRTTRIAATGRLWLADLRRYLDRLVELALQQGEKPEGALAAAILRNDEALFSLPSSEGRITAMTAATLRDGMPPELRCVDNFYRHRLNQRLQANQVDPELRHAQLGWVVSSAHFHADLSPCSPVDLGTRLSSTIDALLVADGWYQPSARKTRWTWARVPLPDPVDWDAAFATQMQQHNDELKRIRTRLRERWKEFERPVMSRLADAFREFCPLLQVDVERKCLVHVAGGRDVDLGPDQHALICERVRQRDVDPASAIEAVMARIILYNLVRCARRKGLVRGPVPSRPYLTVTSDPSPFIPGLGIAVRHAHGIRDALQAQATVGSKRDFGKLTAWSVLAFSMYRRLPWARAATGAVKTALRAQKRSHVIRIAAKIGDDRMHMVFGGSPATLLLRQKRRAPTSPPPTLKALEDWAITHLSLGLDWGGAGIAAAQLEGALAAAGRIELSGIERCLFQAGPNTAAESPVRCVAHDDGWPVHTVDHHATRNNPSVPEPPIAEEAPSKTPQDLRKNYLQLAGLLNKRSFGQNRAAMATKPQTASDGQHGWRRALRAKLEKLREDAGANSNLAVVIGYALNHLRYGSEDGHRLTQNSLHREVTQFGWPLIALLANRSLLSLSADELLRVYRGITLSKSVKARPYVVEELQRFQRFLMRVHMRPSVDMTELAAIAGARDLGIEPGLLTEAERRAVFEELRRDEETEEARADASPEFRRLAQLRQVFYLILEASGIRPGSAYGLTLGDVHLLDESRDFIHVRISDYGEAKTPTSLGFVPLTGALWQENRDWMQTWLQHQRATCPETWQNIPLFAVMPRQRTRVHERQLSGRINALLKWATGNPEAHVYWLRKARISERFQALSRRHDVLARQVYGALVASGHAWIQTTIERYINDPASLLFADLKTADESSRALLLSASGLNPGPLDAAWNRAGADGVVKVSIVLDRVGAEFMSPPEEHRVSAPALRRFKPLRPIHVDAYARAMHKHANMVAAAMEAGITTSQAIELDKAASTLFIRRGYVPWKLASQVEARYVLSPPRKLAGTDKWFGQLDHLPSLDLKQLAESWATQTHVERLHGAGVILRVDPKDLLATHNLLGETGLKLQIAPVDGHHLINEGPRAGNEKGHGAALRWVLSIVWIFEAASNHDG